MTERAMGVTRACGLVGISRSLLHYESCCRVDDEALTGRMMAIAAQKRRYGYRRIHVLLQRDGCFAIESGWLIGGRIASQGSGAR
ncbi:transposase [Burkholderia pseudomallei]|uniref:transposase n=1 Tax=Burkholderia pseudomallei TaxID=28450 RepID=UPI00057219AA|nr:transposase [Burkholderia pseudomallei]OMS57027.1 transposase [Burkholderia pseudomallei]OMS61699.1 transposase [Burkholderia pseudomallei]OMS76195.1 transposase [Burkholderia pseudomallei]OMS91156.1 transposase [Burkholderia pseudomallei]